MARKFGQVFKVKVFSCSQMKNYLFLSIIWGHSQAAFTLRGGIHKNGRKWASLGLIIEDHKDGQKGSKSAYNLLDRPKPKIFFCFCHAK